MNWSTYQTFSAPAKPGNLHSKVIEQANAGSAEILKAQPNYLAAKPAPTKVDAITNIRAAVTLYSSTKPTLFKEVPIITK